MRQMGMNLPMERGREWKGVGSCTLTFQRAYTDRPNNRKSPICPHLPPNPPSPSKQFPVGMRFAAQALQRDCPYAIPMR